MAKNDPRSDELLPIDFDPSDFDDEEEGCPDCGALQDEEHEPDCDEQFDDPFEDDL